MISDAAQAAEDCRLKAGLALDEPIADLLLVTEKALGYHVYLIDLPGGAIEGAHLLDDGQHFVFLAALAGNGTRFHPLRQRFTLAHEIGHGHLGHGSVIDEAVEGDGETDEERAADDFASTFLMPIQAIEAWLGGLDAPGVSTLDEFCAFANHFGVSSPAAWRRLRDETLFTSDAARRDIRADVDSQKATVVRKKKGFFRYQDSIQRLYEENGFHLPSALHAEVDDLLARGLVSHTKAADFLDGRSK